MGKGGRGIYKLIKTRELCRLIDTKSLHFTEGGRNIMNYLILAGQLDCFAFHKIIILHKINGQYFLFTPLHFCQKLQKFSTLL